MRLGREIAPSVPRLRAPTGAPWCRRSQYHEDLNFNVSSGLEEQDHHRNEAIVEEVLLSELTIVHPEAYVGSQSDAHLSA